MTETLVPAPLWRQIAAAVIDIGAAIGMCVPVALGVGAAIAPAVAWQALGKDVSDEDPAQRLTALLEPLKRPRWKHANAQAALTLQIAHRNRSSSGARVMGVRTVDAATGGPVRVRSVLVAQLFHTARSGVTAAVFAPWSRRERAAAGAAEAHSIDPAPVLEPAPPDEPEAGRTGTYTVTVNCLPSLALAAATLGSELVTALLSPERRTLTQYVDGTRVVRA